jgi:hypothetical protein
VLFSLLAVLLIWVVALAGYFVAKNSRLTADKVRAYAESVDLSKLSGDARARAIRKLAQMLNGLSADERQKARLEGTAWKWLERMTEEEKAGFIEATMPTGFKQMLTSFEQLPEDKRRRSVQDAVARLREAQMRLLVSGAELPPGVTNGALSLSPELLVKIRTMGLNAFYSQSSAQTKAELAPVLEELQRVMESGRPFRGR